MQINWRNTFRVGIVKLCEILIYSCLIVNILCRNNGLCEKYLLVILLKKKIVVVNSLEGNSWWLVSRINSLDGHAECSRDELHSAVKLHYEKLYVILTTCYNEWFFYCKLMRHGQCEKGPVAANKFSAAFLLEQSFHKVKLNPCQTGKFSGTLKLC